MSLVVFPSFCFAPSKMFRPATKSISSAIQVAAISPASKTTSMSSATQTVSISPASKTTPISPASKITSTSSDTPPTPASADTDHLAELIKRLDTLERRTSCNEAGLGVLELRTSDFRLTSGAADLGGRMEVLEARTSRSLDATVQMVQELTSSLGVMQVAVRQVQELLC